MKKKSFVHNGQTFYEGSIVDCVLVGSNTHKDKVKNGEITCIQGNMFWVGQDISKGDNQNKKSWPFSWQCSFSDDDGSVRHIKLLKLADIPPQNPDDYEIYN